MKIKYSFRKVTTSPDIANLKKDWLATLTSPQDGMWESFRNSAIHWEIISAEKSIGYACVNHQKQLLQFYITPEYLSLGEDIFKNFIKELEIKTGIVGTNNPIYLSVALDFTKELEVHSYLFSNRNDVSIPTKKGTLRECQLEDLEKLISFCQYSLGAPKEWLKEYLGDLIKKKEIFMLELDVQIIGTCEVRKSTTATTFADIGMIVSPDFRRQGYGTYLLNKAAEIAL